MERVVFVLVDGLNVEASCHMGYLQATLEAGAVHGRMQCELPPLSRPVYATLFTGLSPLTSGICHNDAWELSRAVLENSLFARLQRAGRQSAVAAYHWMRELYTGQPYNAAAHRLTLATELPMPNGIFYNNDAYPDDYVFQDAEALRLRCTPDFLLVHTMGVDYAGHCHGGGSAPYRNAARHVDMLLARQAPQWCAEGYRVIVTSDHGMHPDAAHNDTSPDVREVPFWILGGQRNLPPAPDRQTGWYAFLCALLEV